MGPAKYGLRMNFFTFLLVGAGSALGGMARFAVSQLVRTGGRFPWATLTVNVAGSFILGLVGGLLAKSGGADGARSVRLFAVVGFCGGFTTFSTFSNETFELMRGGQWALATGSALVSLVCGLAAIGAGCWISR